MKRQILIGNLDREDHLVFKWFVFFFKCQSVCKWHLILLQEFNVIAANNVGT